MNKVMLSGRLTKDIELKFTPNGVPVGSFTIASNRRFKKEGQPEADFINCIVWQKLAENAANLIGKGCRVNIVGRWETRNFEGQDGKRVFVNECVVEEMDFIDYANSDNKEQQQGQEGYGSKSNTNTGGGTYGGGNRQSGGDSGYQSKTTNNNSYTRVDDDPFSGGNEIDIEDDSLPF